MKSRNIFRVLLVFVALLVAVALCVVFLHQRTTISHQGRSLAFWLASLGNAEVGDGLLMTDAQSWLDTKYPGKRVAFIDMGPEAGPILLHELRVKDRLWDRFMAKHAGLFARLGVTNTPASVRGKRAALALAMSGEVVKQYLPELQLAFSDPATRNRAAWGMLAVGDVAVPWLSASLDSQTNAAVVEACCWILSQRGEFASNSIPHVLPHLNHPSGMTRSIVAWSVGRMTTDSDILVPALLPLLKDSNRYARNGAAGSLARLGPRAASAIPEFLEAIESAEPDEQRYRIEELRKISSEAASQVKAKSIP